MSIGGISFQSKVVLYEEMGEDPYPILCKSFENILTEASVVIPMPSNLCSTLEEWPLKPGRVGGREKDTRLMNIRPVNFASAVVLFFGKRRLIMKIILPITQRQCIE